MAVSLSWRVFLAGVLIVPGLVLRAYRRVPGFLTFPKPESFTIWFEVHLRYMII